MMDQVGSSLVWGSIVYCHKESGLLEKVQMILPRRGIALHHLHEHVFVYDKRSLLANKMLLACVDVVACATFDGYGYKRRFICLRSDRLVVNLHD